MSTWKKQIAQIKGAQPMHADLTRCVTGMCQGATAGRDQHVQWESVLPEAYATAKEAGDRRAGCRHSAPGLNMEVLIKIRRR